jgi:hypothetical protein
VGLVVLVDDVAAQSGFGDQLGRGQLAGDRTQRDPGEQPAGCGGDGGLLRIAVTPGTRFGASVIRKYQRTDAATVRDLITDHLIHDPGATTT